MKKELKSVTPSPKDGALVGPGFCDFCGEEAPQLKVIYNGVIAGMCYCEKCSETKWDKK